MLDSRSKGSGIQRRRGCPDCNARFPTFETIGYAVDHVPGGFAALQELIAGFRSQIDALEKMLNMAADPEQSADSGE